MATPDASEAQMSDERASVEVVYAMPEQQHVVRLAFETGLTAGEACRRSGLAERFGEIATRPLVLGVHGTRVDENFRLAPGDRVEICRPLVADPRRMRADLASAGRVMGRGRPDGGS